MDRQLDRSEIVRADFIEHLRFAQVKLKAAFFHHKYNLKECCMSGITYFIHAG